MKKIAIFCIAAFMLTCNNVDHPTLGDSSPPDKQVTERDPTDPDPCCAFEIMVVSDDAPLFGSYLSQWQVLPLNSGSAIWTGIRSVTCSQENLINLNTWYDAGCLPPGDYRISFSRNAPCNTYAIGTSQVSIRGSLNSCTIDLTTTSTSNPVYAFFSITGPGGTSPSCLIGCPSPPN